MNMFNNHIGRFPLGVWIAILVLLLMLIVTWGGQAYSLPQLGLRCRPWAAK